MNPNILIVGNNNIYIEQILLVSKYNVEFIQDGIEGIIQFQKKGYELVIVDTMTQNLDAYSLCKIIRSQSTVPIIMLSTLQGNTDEIKGFQVGIDDFITNACSIEVFLYRVEAVLRRHNTNTSLQFIQFKEISLCPDAYIVHINGQKKKLTTKEFEILHIFLKNPGSVLSREYLLNEVWGYDYYGDHRIIDGYIKKIRKKLNIPYIKTVTGIGYKMGT